MLLRQMRYFVAVADCRSFTEAAEQCYIFQSAISQQIRALEADLGVELIHRENRRFSLTPAGEYFYRQSKGLLGQVEAVRRETVRIGQDQESQLRIGYPRNYSGQELHQAVAEFSRMYPEVAISIVNGTHEELYDLLRFGEADLILNDQRRAFSDQYVNYELLRCDCLAEIPAGSFLADQDAVELEDLRHIPCILVAPGEQQSTEEAYYKNTVGFGGSFLFAGNLEEGRLMVAGNRGFLPVDKVGTLSPAGAAVKRLPILQGGQKLRRNYCLFWMKEHSSYYIEEFAGMLRTLLVSEE